MTDIAAVTSFESPESSIVKGARYDADTQTLTIDLCRKIDGEVRVDAYAYAGVVLGLWEEFVQAESKGGFFAGRIRPLYVGRKVTP